MATLISTCEAVFTCKPTKRTVGEQSSFVRGYDTVATKPLSEVLAISDLMRSACSGVKTGCGSWMGTVMYTFSDSHPCGVVSNYTKVTAAGCRTNNIPTV